MKIVYSEKHSLHAPETEICGGVAEPCFEKPARGFAVYETVKALNQGEILAPVSFPVEKITRVHDPDYVEFLRTAYQDWQAAGFKGEAFAHAYNVQHPGAPVPSCIEGKLGYFTGDGTVAITSLTWEAQRISVDVALTAQSLLGRDDSSAFALCRPPGHHATAAAASGYCYLNNAAIATQALLDSGAGRVAVLDVDYHHGNGTQDIFYHRDDVFFVSLHADPAWEYPYFRGYGNETGAGKGSGFNLNFPLPLGTGWEDYRQALVKGIEAIRQYSPDVLVVSLGVDTFRGDPISKFMLDTPDYLKLGEDIASLAVPTLFVMEGGYAIAEIGANVTNVLGGFLDNFSL